MTVYAFGYCECIYESSTATMSLHQTKKGAYKAMRAHLDKGYAEWRDGQINHGKWKDKFGDMESWQVYPIEIQE